MATVSFGWQNETVKLYRETSGLTRLRCRNYTLAKWKCIVTVLCEWGTVPVLFLCTDIFHIVKFFNRIPLVSQLPLVVPLLHGERIQDLSSDDHQLGHTSPLIRHPPKSLSTCCVRFCAKHPFSLPPAGDIAEMSYLGVGVLFAFWQWHCHSTNEMDNFFSPTILKVFSSASFGPLFSLVSWSFRALRTPVQLGIGMSRHITPSLGLVHFHIVNSSGSNRLNNVTQLKAWGQRLRVTVFT